MDSQLGLNQEDCGKTPTDLDRLICYRYGVGMRPARRSTYTGKASPRIKVTNSREIKLR